VTRRDCILLTHNLPQREGEREREEGKQREIGRKRGRGPSGPVTYAFAELGLSSAILF
jgi:hypothetical protein